MIIEKREYIKRVISFLKITIKSYNTAALTESRRILDLSRGKSGHLPRGEELTALAYTYIEKYTYGKYHRDNTRQGNLSKGEKSIGVARLQRTGASP